MDDHDEMLRTRERLHKIESTVTAIDWRLQIVSDKVTEMSPKVAALARADEIADAVSDRLNGQQTLRLTRWQLIGALLGTVALIADVVSRFLH